MRLVVCRYVCLIFIATWWLLGSKVLAASASPSLLKAKQEAEAKAYIFEASRDDIILANDGSFIGSAADY